MNKEVFVLKEFCISAKGESHFSVKVFKTYEKACEQMFIDKEEHKDNVTIIKENSNENSVVLLDDDMGLYNFSIEKKEVL